MASKGPKPPAQKRATGSSNAGPAGDRELPPVPFLASPAQTAPVLKSPAKRAAVKPAVADTAIATAEVATPAPVSVDAGAADRVSPSVSTPDTAPAVLDAPAPESLPQTPSTPALAAATAITQKDLSTMDATINTAAETAQTQAKTMFTDVNDRAKTAMEKGSKMIADLNDFSKGNLEAVVESSKIAAKGAEEIARYTSDYVRTTVEKASTTASQFAAVKSPTEFFKLHSEMTKQAMDSMMAETAKFTENYVKLLGEIAQPISNRVAVAVEKVKVAA
jgi:phasin family protein